MKHPNSDTGHWILAGQATEISPLHPLSPPIYSGEKLRQEPLQGPSLPSFHHFPTRPGAVPENLQIKGQSRLVNYNLCSPPTSLGGSGQGVQRSPRPTPKSWGGGVPKEAGFLLTKDFLGLWRTEGTKVFSGLPEEDATGE